MPGTHIEKLYRPPFGLFLDLYHLTMAYGFWKNELAERRAAFHLFYRSPPFDHPFVLAAGLELVIDVLESFRFAPEDIQYLGGLRGSTGAPLFSEAFLNYLQRWQFQCDIDAVPEGTVVFPHQPLLRAEGPLLQVQILESAMLNLINFSSLIATKAGRMVRAAQGDAILEFGLRRAQGIDGALTASRSAFIGGVQATSNVMAGRYYGIPVKGTHAHSWVMLFDEEVEAFRAYARAMPDNCIFLVDTYDTLEGVRHAIQVGRAMREAGYEMNGIRLDSGDLADLSRKARRMLDEAGFPEATIVASNNMDEYRVAGLKGKGAPIDTWGIGTRLVTAQDDPALGGVYKLSAVQAADGSWEDRIKLSEETIKISNPGRQQVKRFFDGNGRPCGDMLYDPYHAYDATFMDYTGEKTYNLAGKAGTDLLQPIYRKGKLVYEVPDLKAVRAYCQGQQKLFEGIHPASYPLGLESGLHARKKRQVAQIRLELENPEKANP